VEQVDPERLKISYQNGKVIDQQKGIALTDLESEARFITAIRLRHRLSDEISLFGLLGEVNSSIVGLGDDLLEFAGTQDQHVITLWSDRLGAIAGGPLTNEIVFQLGAVTAYADSIEARCSPPAANLH
jgi:hypothetical protein